MRPRALGRRGRGRPRTSAVMPFAVQLSAPTHLWLVEPRFRWQPRQGLLSPRREL